MRIIVVSLALLGCAFAGLTSQAQTTRPPMFGPNAKQPPITQADVDRKHAEAIACSSRIAETQARIGTAAPDIIAKGAWDGCKDLWSAAILAFGAYGDTVTGKPKTWDEPFDRISTAGDGLWRRWRASSDRIVARVRGEGPRL